MEIPFVIGICGGTCCGKTTICDMLEKYDITLLKQDSYYKGGDSSSNFDHPDAIDWVQLISDLLQLIEGKGINNFMVEVGGEVYAIGKNDKGLTWTIGIDKPIEQGRQLITTLKLDAMSMATSGNYRKFKEINGKKMGHIINPKTGFPGYSNILSVSVLTRYCYRADALATGLMNMSSQEIKEFDQNMNDVQLILIELNEGDTTIYVSRELREKVGL